MLIGGGIYHVCCRASLGEAVFADQAETAAFVGVLQRIKEWDGLVLFAWAGEEPRERQPLGYNRR